MCIPDKREVLTANKPAALWRRALIKGMKLLICVNESCSPAPRRWKPRGDGGVDVLSNALKSDQLIFLLCVCVCVPVKPLFENTHTRESLQAALPLFGLLCPQRRLTGVVLPDEQSSAVCSLKK